MKANEIRYHFAKDEQGTLTDIDNVTDAERKAHTYHCISCNAEMVAKLGARKQHHFAHKSDGTSCSSESYLHKLGKMIIKKMFDESDHFYIEYKAKYKCDKEKHCPLFRELYCEEEHINKQDLKRWYHKCEEEQSIGDFKADLLLSNDKLDINKSLLIEICVTHECTQEKKESGYKIIEININSEKDVKNLLKSDAIKETIGYNKNDIKIKFYNFKNEFEGQFKEHIIKFRLFKSGKAHVETKSQHKELEVKENSIVEIDFCQNVNYNMAYEIGLSYANESYNNRFKNCKLCKYYKTDTRSNSIYPTICALCKKFGTPEQPDQTFAESCQYYRVDENKRKKVLNILKNYLIR